MRRLHTRVKRLLGISTKRMHGNRSYVKISRAKTFPTQESANKYAAEVMKLGHGSYSLESTKKNRRFKIVAK